MIILAVGRWTARVTTERVGLEFGEREKNGLRELEGGEEKESLDGATGKV